MKKILLTVVLFSSVLFSKEYIINLKGNEPKENFTIKLELNVDEEGKPLSEQRYDIRNIEKIKSLKIITASGLVGTLKDEREILVYYKTNLNVNGLKIRNLYKTAITRIYGEENNITMNFDPDHYQNIVSYLRYHNVKNDVIKDIDNIYGTWEEVE